MMEECFEFDLGFLGQSEPTDFGDCSYTDSRELARRIAETNSLVQTVNSLSNEKESLTKQLIELTKSANEVQCLYKEQNQTVISLKKSNEQNANRVVDLEREVSSLQDTLTQKVSYFNQLEENWRRTLETEKQRYSELLAQKTAAEKLEKASDKPSTLESRRTDIPANAAKKRDSNKASRMVSRGTQYQYSTTTRSTCTSAFIRKHNVAVNFPEVVPITIEDIFKQTLIEVPRLLSPIRDIEYAAITEMQLKRAETVSVGTCTDVCNIRRQIEYKTNSEMSDQFARQSSASFWRHVNERSQPPQLCELWDLLGQTIFALIGNSGEGNSITDGVRERIDIFKNQLRSAEGGLNYFNTTEIFNYPVVNIPKIERNQSSCSSPVPETADSKPTEIVDPNAIECSNPACVNETLYDIHGENRGKLEPKDEEHCRNENANHHMEIEQSQNDVELAKIKLEMERLERKIIVISPIRNRCLPQGSNNKQNENSTTLSVSQPSCTEEEHLRESCVPNEKKIESSEVIESISNVPKQKTRRKKRKCPFPKQAHLSKISCESGLNSDQSINCSKEATTSTLDCSPVSECKKNEECVQKNIFRLSDKNIYESGNALTSDKRNDEEINTNLMFRKSNVLEMQIASCDQNDHSHLSTNQLCKNQKCETSQNSIGLCDTTIESEVQDNYSCKPLVNDSKISTFNFELECGEYHKGDDATDAIISDGFESDEEDFYGFASDDDSNSLFIVDDSPKSPEQNMAEQYDYAYRIIPLERLDYDSDDAPASPIIMHGDRFHCPKIIPSETINENFKVKNQSLLSHLISRYKVSKHRLCVQKSSSIVVQDKVLWLLRKLVEQYLLNATYQTECYKYAKRILKRIKDMTTVCSVICEVIEDTTEDICRDFTPPATIMTESHRKILMLIKALDCYHHGFERTLIHDVEQRVFNLKTEALALPRLINLFLLYLGLIDTQNSKTNPARLIIYKCLYYHNRVSHILIYYVLVSYPAVLPAKDEINYEDSDPLIKTIQSILNSMPYDMNNTDLKHREMSHILRLYYKYERVKPSREDVVDILLTNIRSNQFYNVNYCFALLCKRNGLKWSWNYVLNGKLLPLLKEIGIQLVESKNDEKFACILDCISTILKPFPIKTDVSRHQRLFAYCLHVTDRKIVQEAAVMAILRTCRFGYDKCFNLLVRWNPSYKISKQLWLSIQTFVHRSTLNKLKNLQKQFTND